MITICGESDELTEKIADCAFDKLKLSGEAHVELISLNEEEIKSLNAQTRGIDKVTDVLSYPNLTTIKPFSRQNYPFDFDETMNSVFLGSIAICGEVAARQAEEYGHSYERERGYLFLHGLLHLLGYDHIEEADRVVMRKNEEEILSALGVNR